MTNHDDQDRVRQVVLAALEVQGKTRSVVAKAAGIDRGHFSHFLSGKRGLGERKLDALAEVLGIPREAISVAAGMDGARPTFLSTSSIAVQGIPHGEPLQIVTDGRFFDSALFLWILSKQPLATFGVRCELVQVDWPTVPTRISGLTNAIGFYNRWVDKRLGKRSLLEVDPWIDLCVYRGYALLVRERDYKSLMPGRSTRNIERSDANEFIECLRKSKAGSDKPSIVCIGGDTLKAFDTPLNPHLKDENFDFFPVENADIGLRRFLEETGDLFMGGLPQRLRAEENGCVPVVSWSNNPLLFSVNSLVYPRAFTRTPSHRAILSAVASLWFDTISRLQSDAEFRQQVCVEIPMMLASLRVEDHNLGGHLTTALPGPTASIHEDFPSKPTDILNHVTRVITSVFRELRDDQQITRDQLLAIGQHIAKVSGSSDNPALARQPEHAVI